MYFRVCKDLRVLPPSLTFFISISFADGCTLEDSSTSSQTLCCCRKSGDCMVSTAGPYSLQDLNSDFLERALRKARDALNGSVLLSRNIHSLHVEQLHPALNHLSHTYLLMTNSVSLLEQKMMKLSAVFMVRNTLRYLRLFLRKMKHKSTLS
jgi:hypothetical protein